MRNIAMYLVFICSNVTLQNRLHVLVSRFTVPKDDQNWSSRGKSHVIQDNSLLQSTPNPSFANSFCVVRRVSEVFFLGLKDFLPAWIVTRLSSQFHLDGKLNNVTLCAAS